MTKEEINIGAMHRRFERTFPGTVKPLLGKGEMTLEERSAESNSNQTRKINTEGIQTFGYFIHDHENRIETFVRYGEKDPRRNYNLSK